MLWGCSVSDVAARFAFFPPHPPTYGIRKDEVRGGKLVVSGIHRDPSMDVLMVENRKGNKIVAFYLRNPYAKLTVLYSHGNATDLGQLYELFVQLKLNLRVNLMGYDYSGYGASSGKPSESNTYADIEAIYECLQTEYGVSQEDIVLYGQSLGSGPTLHLASRLPRLRGVVLHSAILSGLRVLCHVNFSFCLDIYNNVKKIKKVKSPVLVIHGTDDEVVNRLHGYRLWKLARDPYEPLWIKGGTHCNLELYPDFILHLSHFIKDMETVTTIQRLRKLRRSLERQVTYTKSTTTFTANCCCQIKIQEPDCSSWCPWKRCCISLPPWKGCSHLCCLCAE
ncbi:hypothetical protein KSP39_PZI014766 [Platanthera zijinensis]|uniref:AB hydrolase-1 domain-containing protein n=1 Tax=Platanthera zijinensis TaxID=2320716 RepID=A0AAP0BBX1_9ASPA